MMRIIEIFEITFLMRPRFLTVLLNFCLVVNDIIEIVAKPGVDKNKGAVSASLYVERGIQADTGGIEVIVTLSEITQKLLWRRPPDRLESFPTAYGTVDINKNVFHNRGLLRNALSADDPSNAA